MINTCKNTFVRNESDFTLDRINYHLSHFFIALLKFSLNKQFYHLEIHFNHISQKCNISIIIVFFQNR